ncbi:MAG: hypothetical protein ACSHXW_15200 [Yoonia sp.]
MDPQFTALQAITRSADALFDSFQSTTFSDPYLVPSAGTADYAGYFLGQLANTDDNLTDSITGEMVITVDFAATDMISGTVFGILDDNGDALSGQIDLTGGALDRNVDPNVDATLSFEGDGVLTDFNSNSINLDLVFEGDFLGPDSNGISGNILGRAESEGTSQAVGGSFILEIIGSE